MLVICVNDETTLKYRSYSVMPLCSGWAEWALAHLEFGSSVKHIATKGEDYAHHITDVCPPRFENLTASLLLTRSTKKFQDY